MQIVFNILFKSVVNAFESSMEEFSNTVVKLVEIIFIAISHSFE